MRYRFRIRKIVNAVMFGITGLCTLTAVAVMFFILGYLLWHGGRSVNLAFFTQLPTPPGESGGGMANAIVGSCELIALAVLIGAPIGFLGGIYIAEFAGATSAFVARYVTDLLNGVPSIVLGIFAYALVVVPTRHFSVLAGSVALSVIFIPIAVRTTEQFLQTVPSILREGALALGATKPRTIATIIVPAAARGIATGMMLGVARIAGETAPLLFTSFNNRFWSTGLDQPAASLPVMLFTYAISPYPDWHRQAWAAAVVLLGMVLFTNIAARIFLSPAQRH